MRWVQDLPVQVQYGVPLVNGILTCETEEQIEERAITNNLGVT